MRKKGDKDLKKKRKVRSDKKYKYRKKHGKMQPYISTRQRNDPVKIWFWEIVRKDKDSMKKIPKKFRPTIHRFNYVPFLRCDVLSERLSTRKEIEKLTEEVIGVPGTFLIKMFTHKKNKFHCSPTKVCSVKIMETKDGVKAVFLENFKLFRYWFWAEGKGKKR